MSRLLSGVAVVTSFDDGSFTGTTVSSFVSVSLDPPTVLVCLNRISRGAQVVSVSGVFCVNLPPGSQVAVAAACTKPVLSQAERFRDVRTHTAVTGAPVITGTLSWLDCTVIDLRQVGTHVVVVAAGSSVSPEPPLSYYDRQMHPLAVSRRNPTTFGRVRPRPKVVVWSPGRADRPRSAPLDEHQRVPVRIGDHDRHRALRRHPTPAQG